MKIKFLTLLLVFIFCHDNTKSQVWDNPFFQLEIPATWIKPEPPKRDPSKPARERDCIKQYIDVRLIINPSGEDAPATITVYIYEHCEDQKINSADFIIKRNSDQIISEGKIVINGIPAYEVEKIVKVNDGRGAMIDYYETSWYIQGIKRVYKFRVGSYCKTWYDKQLPLVKTYMNSLLVKEFNR